VPVKHTVALKVIKVGMDTKQVVARFKAEQRALTLMNHPGIAKVLDSDETKEGRPQTFPLTISSIHGPFFWKNLKYSRVRSLASSRPYPRRLT
jgi:serine/threonine protein kinase